MSEDTALNPVELASEITIAWLNNPNNRVSAEEVPGFLRAIHATVNELATGTGDASDDGAKEEEHVPAVSIRRSLASKDHILSLIDGKPYKTLTRHLSSHGLTAEDYRRRYKLRADYPMVAESYAAHRRELAKSIGLGRRPARAADAEPQTDAPATPEQAVAEPKAQPAAAKAKAPARKASPRAKAKAPAKSNVETAPAE